jgi:hypothetical protein
MDLIHGLYCRQVSPRFRSRASVSFQKVRQRIANMITDDEALSPGAPNGGVSGDAARAAIVAE